MRLSRPTNEHGSIPMALLAAIVAGGLIVVLTATAIQGERNVRFDRGFTNAVHTADAGLEQAHYMISSGDIELAVGATSAPRTIEVNGTPSTWEVERLSSRQYEVRSTGVVEGVSRTVVAALVEDALFFPGAFGDRLVALNGNSSLVDSYESASPSCPTPAQPDTCWGTDPDFGTGNGAVGTNNIFNFAGTDQVRRAYLYDWANNPGTNQTEANPGGSRCQEGAPRICIPDKLRFVDKPLEYGSDEEVKFIFDRLDDCSGRELGKLQLGRKGNQKHDETLSPQSTDLSDNLGNPSQDGWDNYYCADSLEIYGDVSFPDATPETPVVIFVRDAVSIANQVNVNCVGCTNDYREVRPKAASLQIYVATEYESGGADVTIAAGSRFAGVIYAPRASCGAPGGAGADIYGSIVCRRLDNVGNWQFHFDDALADLGRGVYSIASWREEPGVIVGP